MAADLNIKRNGGYVVRAVLSGILLLLAAAGLIFLLTRLIPGRILLWIAGGVLLALLLLIAGVWFFCPFDPERALREQGDGVGPSRDGESDASARRAGLAGGVHADMIRALACLRKG